MDIEEREEILLHWGVKGMKWDKEKEKQDAKDNARSFDARKKLERNRPSDVEKLYQDKRATQYAKQVKDAGAKIEARKEVVKSALKKRNQEAQKVVSEKSVMSDVKQAKQKSMKNGHEQTNETSARDKQAALGKRMRELQDNKLTTQTGGLTEKTQVGRDALKKRNESARTSARINALLAEGRKDDDRRFGSEHQIERKGIDRINNQRDALWKRNKAKQAEVSKKALEKQRSIEDANIPANINVIRGLNGRKADAETRALAPYFKKLKAQEKYTNLGSKALDAVGNTIKKAKKEKKISNVISKAWSKITKKKP